MATSINNEIISYNPSSLIGIFNNALTIEITKKAFRIRGIYIAGKGVNYNGWYYDSIKDESGDGCATLIVPASIRHTLTSEQTIECTAYLSKKAQLNGGRIDLQVNVIEILSQQESKYSEEQLQMFDILQRKAELGHKDVDGFIKTRIIQNEKIIVTIIIGKNAIIDSDIKHQLKEALAFYDFRFIRINLNSEVEIIRALKQYDGNFVIVCLARGGGDNMSIFNKISLAEEALSLKCFFLTAIGHKEDESLLQKVADKAFITPTALAQYFNDIFNNTLGELQNTKAKLVEEITTQLKGNYDIQIKNVNEQLRGYKELSEQQLRLANSQVSELKTQLAKKSSIPTIVWIIIVLIAAVIGTVLGHLLFGYFGLG